MKTIKYTTKTFLRVSIIATLMFSSFNSFTQDGVIWSQMKNFENVEIHVDNNKLFSSNPDVQELINNYSIYKIELAVPTSRKSTLQNLVEITCDCDETDLLVAISKLTNIFTQPEIGPHYETLFVPNDYSIAFVEDYALDLINAQQAWDVTKGDSSIIVAISDQNFYVNHEDLVGKIHNYDTTNISPQGHGTAVAVTAAGNTNNGIGKSSIGYNSELALYRMSYDDLLTASYSGSRVINTSWTSGCTISSYVQDIIDEVYENGSIVVAAAGNGGTCGGPTNLVYPAACNHVISVTSIGSTDNHELYAGDPSATHQHNSDVDICAPGLLVPITMGPEYYIVGNGSSFATPFVSGTIALMLSVDSCLSFEDIETILYSTAVNIDGLNPQYAGLLGNGRLDAGAAVLMANTYMSCNGGVDPTPPTPPTVHSSDKTNVDIATQPSVGLNEIEASELIDLKLYPNPTNAGSIITIQSSYKIENCEITNVNGEIIQVVLPIEDKLTISNLTQGAYFAKVNFETGVTKIKRIIVF